jgi:hypothetical protein
VYRIYFAITATPILGDGQSVAYRIYNAASLVICYVFWVGEVVELIRSLDNIEEVLECARLTIPITCCRWIDIYMRYRYLIADYG